MRPGLFCPRCFSDRFETLEEKRPWHDLEWSDTQCIKLGGGFIRFEMHFGSAVMREKDVRPEYFRKRWHHVCDECSFPWDETEFSSWWF